MSARPSPFDSFIQGGFECSTHRRRDGRRLDLIAETQHDSFALKDYQALQKLGIRTVRDGIRWHLIETVPYRYDFSSALPMVRAARRAGMQVVWDLCHYGWPDGLDVFSAEFVNRIAGLAGAFAALLRDETNSVAIISPLNEPSFLSWVGGDEAHINPFQRGRGFELKQQLVRATIAATEAIWRVLPHARICHCEPAIHIIADPLKPQDREAAEGHRLFQFQALDMLSGRLCPELGGSSKYFDLIGLNYYWNNQWIHKGRTLLRNDPLYRPFRDLIAEFHRRYECDLFIAETGREDMDRPGWFRYIAGEAAAAIREGVPLHGICWYPILNHPGWDNGRHCYCGLLDYPGEHGHRKLYEPLAVEMQSWQQRLEKAEQLELA